MSSNGLGAGVAAGVQLGPLEIAAGAMADIGTKMTETHKALLADLHRQPLNLPYSVNYPGAASPPSPVVMIIPYFPRTGRMWYVCRTSIVGSDGHTPVTGTADIYMGPGQGGVEPASLVYAGLTIPTVIVEGRYHNPVHSNDRVYALVYGLPANTPVTLSVMAEEYPVSATEATYV